MKIDVQVYINQHYPTLQVSGYVDERNIVYLEGDCNTWQAVVDIGHAVAKLEGVRSVVNDITVNGEYISRKDYTPYIEIGKNIGIIDKADIVIVGAGVSGCGIARELARYDLKIVVVEKDEDVANGATKANNGDIHSGYLEKPGALKTKLNVKGNAMYDKWASDLNFEFVRCGNLLITEDEECLVDLKDMQERARLNNVPCEIISGDKVLDMEPLARKNGLKPVAALYVPSMATVDPWEVAIALAENAVDNGVKVILDCTVGAIEYDKNGVKAVITNKGIIETEYIINCAGVYADEISEMAGDKCYTIHPRKGTIAIIDKTVEAYNRPVRMVDKNRRMANNTNSKGGGMATTIAKNNLLGPSATEVPDKEDMETTRDGLTMAMERSSLDIVGYSNIIRFFSGTRPATYTEDFYIALSEKTARFINVGGIQSPGLAAAPAVAEMVVNILLDDMQKRNNKPQEHKNFNPIRKAHTVFSRLSREEQDKLITERPEYGRIICRCETITEGEILDALHSNIIPVSVDAIKRRTRAGMGRCQGGFCEPRVVEIISRVLKKDPSEITLKGRGSNILIKDNRSPKGTE